jgi:curved DNA-binding protein CbpA
MRDTYMEINRDIQGLIDSRVRPNMAKSYYKVLEVGTNATRRDIRESYIRLKKTYSLKNQAFYSIVSEEEAKESLELIEEAFRVLDDSVLRKKYDDQLTSNEQAGGLEPLHGASVSLDVSAQAPALRTKIKRIAEHAAHSDAKRRISELMETSETDGDGDLFRQIRGILRVSHEELNLQTKVSVTYLNAIENNIYDSLPASAYVRGFLSCCLKYMGVNESNAFVNAYCQKLELWKNNKNKKMG